MVCTSGWLGKKERKKNCCDAIPELSETNQMLFFTCHPEIVRIIQEKSLGPKGYLPVINLNNSYETVHCFIHHMWTRRLMGDFLDFYSLTRNFLFLSI
ncbi:hypothetical protein [Methanoplanus limicola]|uniref:hypothetical protein n=1 Tax=Methanoplanus limicola TaxID=2315 RepID=UPI00064F4CF8|nr:hypothetical protein [Methanoplanus limicola]